MSNNSAQQPADHGLGFEIEPDITIAQTPPSRIYHDVSVFEAAKDQIFARTWQFVGTPADVRVPGAVHPLTLLPGCLSEPLLLVRDRNDELSCLSNVCTHRGMVVCEHPGIETGLRCRYHGRRFGLDGCMQSMPEFEAARDFPSAGDDLPRVRLAQWGPFLFASLDPAMPFDDWIRPVQERVGWMSLDQFHHDPSRSRDYLVSANWALYCENYLEGLHIPFVHPSLNDTLDYGAYRTELFEYASLQLGIGGGTDDVFELPDASPDHGDDVVGYYFWLFPNLMLNFYPWGLSMNVVKPLGPDRTRVSFVSFVWDESRLAVGTGAELDRVEREDESVVELVQSGVRSRLYDRGRYSPTREQGTHHFHRLLGSFLSGSR